MSPKDPFARELWNMARAMQHVAMLAHRTPDLHQPVPQLRRVTVTEDITTAAETCVDCGCEVTAGDLLCETCDDVRQLTEQSLSRGEE